MDADLLQSCFQHTPVLLVFTGESPDIAFRAAWQRKSTKVHKSALFFFFFNYNAFYFSCSTHSIALKWNFVFRYKYTPCAPQLLRSMSWHQPVSLCQTLRDRTTSTSLKTLLWACRGRKEKKKWYFILREPWTAKCTPPCRNHTKTPQGTKREKQLGDEKATSSSATV